MGPEFEGRGPTVEEAVQAALSSAGLGRADVDVEVVREPGAEPLDADAEAVVRVRARTAGSGDLEEQADTAADFIDELLARMEIDAIADPIEVDGHMYIDIVDGSEDDMALLIGRRGQTLEAIQELTRMVVGRKLDQRIRVIVDIGDYRKRRTSELEERAREIAGAVLDSGSEEELDPMNAYERKLVHDAVAEIDGVESTSRGEEPNRYVVIRRT